MSVSHVRLIPIVHFTKSSGAWPRGCKSHQTTPHLSPSSDKLTSSETFLSSPLIAFIAASKARAVKVGLAKYTAWPDASTQTRMNSDGSRRDAMRYSKTCTRATPEETSTVLSSSDRSVSASAAQANLGFKI